MKNLMVGAALDNINPINSLSEVTNEISSDGFNLDLCLKAMNQSLTSEHVSMRTNSNPVMCDVLLNGFNKLKQKSILKQYCILPAEIVNLLTITHSRLHAWPTITDELTRNLNEEKGSRTGGVAHYHILIKVIQEELALDVDKAAYAFCTTQFLHSLKQSLAEAQPSHVVGSIYALESSAIPELVVVAEFINKYALLTGHENPPIELPCRYIKPLPSDFNLNLFFAMHLLDFEVGHKNGLAKCNAPQYSAGGVE